MDFLILWLENSRNANLRVLGYPDFESVIRILKKSIYLCIDLLEFCKNQYATSIIH